jgi:hypothetical protein
MSTEAGTATAARGDELPGDCGLIEVRVAELRQLFNAIDPSPFREKDLDPNAEEFIVSWAREMPKEARLALLVHLEREAGSSEDADLLRDAVREFFGERARATRRQLRQLFRIGRVSLIIGLAFLAVSIGVGDLMTQISPGSRLASLVSESLLIGGWVTMWRPLEIFLYEWWPIRAEARLFDRLSTMLVRITYAARAPQAPRHSI